MLSLRSLSRANLLPMLFSVWSGVGVVLLVMNWQTPLGAWGDFIFLALGAAVLAQAVGNWLGWQRMAILAVWVAVVSGVLETVGALTGYPFGVYHYTENMGPLLGGVLPAAIPLAWWLVVLPLWCLVRCFCSSKAWWVVVLYSSLLAVWTDVLLEPLATTVRAYWLWQEGGSYYGVPWLNFGGWWVVSMLIVSGMEFLTRWWGIPQLSALQLRSVLFPYWVTIGVFCLSTWVQVEQGYLPGTIGAFLLLSFGVLYRTIVKR